MRSGTNQREKSLCRCGLVIFSIQQTFVLIIKGQYGTVVICRGPQRNMGNLFANYKCMQLQVQERVQRIVMWINQNFLLSEELETKADLDVEFLVLRDNSSLTFSMDGKGVLNITTNINISIGMISNITGVDYLNRQHGLSRRPCSVSRDLSWHRGPRHCLQVCSL